MMTYEKDRIRYINTLNNSRGHNFESAIEVGCEIYRRQGRADVDKTSEPFRVMRKYQNGTFLGQFIAKAEPDYHGTLSGGRSIYFEAKSTSTKRLKQDVVTQEQKKKLDAHTVLGAYTGVCACIQYEFFFIPWDVWRHMGEHFGHKYVTAEEIQSYRVVYNGAVMFLDYARDFKR